MSGKTSIEWTDFSWNPIRARHKTTGKVGWHCEHVSEGCRNCYAEAINLRLGTQLPYKPGHLRGDVEMFLDERTLLLPLRWRNPRRVFVCSMTDLFADFVPEEWLDQVYAVMALARRHTFQVLTKRPERMRGYLSSSTTPERIWFNAIRIGAHERPECLKDEAKLPWPLSNVWAMTSAEGQLEADLRLRHLLRTPAAVRGLSLEPLLWPIDLRGHLDYCPTHDFRGGFGIGPCPDRQHVDWVIVGGESGRSARPMHPDWVRSLRDQCKAAGVAYFFKQWGEWEIVSDANGYRGSVMPETGKRFIWIGRSGNTYVQCAGKDDDCYAMARAGKARAGRLLDGRTWDEMPTVGVAP